MRGTVESSESLPDVARIVAAGGGFRCPCVNLRKAARAITQLYEEALRPSGVRMAQLPILIAIHGRRSTSITRLARDLVLDRTTLTRTLDRMERAGLVRIEGKDRGVRKITLTRKGRDRLARAFPIWQETQRKVGRGLGEERLDRLLADLASVVALAKGGQ